MQRTKSKTISKMEAKKSRPASSTTKKEGKSIIAFVGDVKQEFKKVEWTSKEELVMYTKIVVASTFLLGFFVYLIDLGVQSSLNAVHFFVKVLFG